MAFIVTEACIKCRYTDCVDVCPVDCFHEGPKVWPVITDKQEPLPDAEKWAEVTGKLGELQEA